MNNGYIFSIPLLLISFLSFEAHAEDVVFSWGLGVGSSQFKLNETELAASYASLSSASTFNDSSTSFDFFGGMNFDEHLSLELNMSLAGDIVARESGRNIKLFDVSTVAVTIALSTQVAQSTQLFARLGVHLWDISASFDSSDSINSAVDLTYGFGADINIYGDRSRQMRVQWNHYEYDGIFLDSNDSLTFSVLFMIGAK